MIPRIHIRGPIAYRLVRESAITWRRLLRQTCFIAVTGSAGKTVTMRSLAAMLTRMAPVHASWDGANSPGAIAKTILETKRHHRFAVMETGSVRPGSMALHSEILQPDLAVILNIRATHLDIFSTVEDVALEKWSLTKHVRPGGALLLNGDDIRVMTMADRKKHRIITFGQSEGCDFRVTDVDCRWPSRLAFQMQHGSGRVRVETQLVGEHWIPIAAAAIGAAVTCGMPLADAARAIRDIDPFPARMQPATLPSRAVMIRDEYCGTLETLDPALTVLREARVARRILVLGDVDDSNLDVLDRMRLLGRRASESCDMAVFVGEHASIAADAAIAAGMPGQLVQAFDSPTPAAQFLKSQLTEGDLVLLKGAERMHMTRIYFAQLGTVQCASATCRRAYLCDLCEDLAFEPFIQIRKPKKQTVTAAASGR